MSNSKNLEIEYLRAVAIGMTLLNHLDILLPFHKPFFNTQLQLFNPWTGVDLFFCISGFVVSKSYLDYFDKHRVQGTFAIAAQSFWLRRIYRLLPTAWLWILIPLVLSITFNQRGAFGSWYENLRSFTAVATFSGNIANQFGMILGPNSVYWSLALEEQFYLVFPLFLLLVTSARWRVGILLSLIALQFVIDRDPFGPPPAGMFSSFRLDAMMWGVLLSLFSRSRLFRQFEPTVLAESPWLRLSAALLLIYLLGAIPSNLIAMPIAVGLIALVSMLLVWIASYQKGYLFCPYGLSGVLEWLGSRSYALYVSHVCAYRVSLEFWHRYATMQGVTLDKSFTLEMLLTATALTLIASELNYRFIETPLRRKGAEIAHQRLQRFTSEQTAIAQISSASTVSKSDLA